MDLDVTSRTIPKPGTTQIMERWRLTGQNSRGKSVTFQAHQAELRPNEHLGVNGTMRCVACHTSFEAHHGMLEGKGPPLVGMAFDAGRFISKRKSGHLRHQAAVRLVTIYTVNSPFE